MVNCGCGSGDRCDNCGGGIGNAVVEVMVMYCKVVNMETGSFDGS